MVRASPPIPAGPILADKPDVHTDADVMARAIYDAKGGAIRLALPLGLGKPITLVNALVRAAVNDPSLSLKIFTALSLQRPEPSSELEKRFLGPAMDRFFGNAPSLAYVDLIKRGELPDNIEVSEFFFQAASWLGNQYAQKQYISANYTHARDVLISQNPNVLAQLMPRDGTRFSMSCNTDISADLFARRSAGEMDFMAVAELNDALPYMGGPAEIDASEIDMVLEPPEQVDLFSVLRRPVGDAQHAIALHVSRLVPDGGTLQIGIGAIGDAVANALIARDRAALHDLWRIAPFPLQGAAKGPFRTGLYAVTEMLVGGLVALFEADILRRQAQDGAVVHAGFFVDARDMYQRLRALPPDRRAKIRMMPVSFTNALYGDEATKRDDRRDARFVNGAMQVSLLGDAMSDSAKPGQVVSGVGGQFNFFEQAFALDDAHAILTLPATRQSGGDLTSNIVWQLPVTTVPRHMRDVVVTEYGTAFLRGLPDEEVIKRLICIADSRFQPDLVQSAKKAGKLDPDWTVPDAHSTNVPETITAWLAPYRDALLPDYPLGTDFTDIEKLLVKALSDLSNAQSSNRALLSLVWAGLTTAPHPREGLAMERMGYPAAPSLADPLQARALRGALRQRP